jgi:hypothetical protein
MMIVDEYDDLTANVFKVLVQITKIQNMKEEEASIRENREPNVTKTFRFKKIFVATDFERLCGF